MITLPSSQRLAGAPEMAILAALDSTAEAAIKALEAIFPGVQDYDAGTMTPAMNAAADILTQAAALRELIEDYEDHLDQTIPLPLRWNAARAPF